MDQCLFWTIVIATATVAVAVAASVVTDNVGVVVAVADMSCRTLFFLFIQLIYVYGTA